MRIHALSIRYRCGERTDRNREIASRALKQDQPEVTGTCENAVLIRVFRAPLPRYLIFLPIPE